MTAKSLAEQTGIASSTIYNWLRDSAPENLGRASLAKVGEVFGLTVEQSSASRPSGGSWRSPGQMWRFTSAALIAELTLGLLLLELRRHPERLAAVLAGR